MLTLAVFSLSFGAIIGASVVFGLNGWTHRHITMIENQSGDKFVTLTTSRVLVSVKLRKGE